MCVCVLKVMQKSAEHFPEEKRRLCVCVCVCVCVCEITWYKIGVRGARSGLAVVSRALVSGGKQDVAVTHTHLGPVGVAVGPLRPAGPAL